MQRQLDFGGSFGGPVVIPHLYNGHNKTFFFFAYEEYHNTQTLNQGTITVPTTSLSQWRSELSLAWSHCGFQWKRRSWIAWADR